MSGILQCVAGRDKAKCAEHLVRFALVHEMKGASHVLGHLFDTLDGRSVGVTDDDLPADAGGDPEHQCELKSVLVVEAAGVPIERHMGFAVAGQHDMHLLLGSEDARLKVAGVQPQYLVIDGV